MARHRNSTAEVATVSELQRVVVGPVFNAALYGSCDVQLTAGEKLKAEFRRRALDVKRYEMISTIIDRANEPFRLGHELSTFTKISHATTVR
jgi:hypothetical protein